MKISRSQLQAERDRLAAESVNYNETIDSLNISLSASNNNLIQLKAELEKQMKIVKEKETDLENGKYVTNIWHVKKLCVLYMNLNTAFPQIWNL